MTNDDKATEEKNGPREEPENKDKPGDQEQSAAEEKMPAKPEDSGADHDPQGPPSEGPEAEQEDSKPDAEQDTSQPEEEQDPHRGTAVTPSQHKDLDPEGERNNDLEEYPEKDKDEAAPKEGQQEQP